MDSIKKSIHLWFKVFLITVLYQKKFPNTSLAIRNFLYYILFDDQLRSGFISSLGANKITDWNLPLFVTYKQVKCFLEHSWNYTEKHLELLRIVEDYSVNKIRIREFHDFYERMQRANNDSFEEALKTIYRDPVYPRYQYVGQSFRNLVTYRQPFIFQVIGNMDHKPLRVCDIGCGAGILLGDILEKYPEIEGYGVDISRNMLNFAKKFLKVRSVKNRCNLVNSDIRELPFSSNSFELITAMEVIEHLPEPLLVIKELTRLLAPGGYIVTSIPVNCPLPGHLELFGSVEKVLELHKLAGLQIEQTHVRYIAPDVPNVLLSSQKLVT